MKKVNLAQGSQEWLDFRKSKIGASEAPIVLGISPYMTPRQLWLEKTGRVESQKNTVVMEFGRRKEDQIRRYWEEKNEDFYQPVVVCSDDHDFVCASLDGLSTSGEFILECKCVNAAAWELAAKNRVVDHHYAQAQHQLMVTGCKCVQFVYYHQGEYREVIVFPDDEYVEKMIEKEREFYQYMIDDKEPPLCERDYIDMNENSEWLALESEAKETYLKYKEYEKKWKDLQDRFKDIADGKNSKGGSVRATVVKRKGNICTKKINDEGIDLEKYRRADTISVRVTVSSD